MSDTTIYILQKDLPENVSGTKFKQDPENNNRYYPLHCFREGSGEYIWKERPIYGICSSAIKDPQWFLPEEEVEVQKAKELLVSKGYCVSVHPEIVATHDAIHNPTVKAHLFSHKYTEEDLRKSFDAGCHYASEILERYRGSKSIVIEKKWGFDDYLKSLNQ